jgi:DNA-binding response OmpR family regulator
MVSNFSSTAQTSLESASTKRHIMTERILVVDDDPQITSLLERYLAKQGFEVICAASGKDMHKILASEKISLCILDVGLPDADGFQLTREIRSTSDLPVIVLSVRNETYDQVLGLEFGADDYVTKPFEPRELVARIRTVLRRSRLELQQDQQKQPSQMLLQFGSWIMNTGARTLVNKETNAEAHLTSMEFDILKAFIDRPHTVLTRDQLLDLAHGPSTYVGDRAIDVHILRLRKKIEPDSAQPRYIKTIHGTGYCLTENVSQLKSTD